MYTVAMGEGTSETKRQESGSTQSFLMAPLVSGLGKTDYRQAYFIATDALTDKSGVIYEFGGKRQKLDLQTSNCNEEISCNLSNEPAVTLCEPCDSPAGLENLNTRHISINRDVTLRQWLGNPGRVVDRFESLHILKQILEFVELAHSQGVVLRNVRPSSFMLSSLHRVSFLDSASSRSSSGSSEPSTGTPSIDGSPLDRLTPNDGLAAIYNEGMPVSPVEITLQQKRNCLGSSSGEEETRPSGRSMANSQVVSRTGGGHCHIGWESDSLNGSFVCQRSSNSGVEYVGDLRGSTEGFGKFPPVRTLLAAGESDTCEVVLLKRSSLLPTSGDVCQKSEVCFSVRQILHMEETWYSTPEELLQGTCTYASDIYSLGVLFFELICPFHSWEEHTRVMLDLRHRILPPRLLSDRPKEAAFCLWLLHPEPTSRPKVREVLQSELLSEVGEALAERQAAIDIEEQEVETELLHEFLLQVQQQKQELANKLTQDVYCLTSDIEEVKRRRASLQHRGVDALSLEEGVRSSKLTQDFRVSRNSVSPNESLLEDSIAHKQERYVKLGRSGGECTALDLRKKEIAGDRDFGKRKEDLRSKSARLMSSFEQLEQVYFAMRLKMEPKISDNTGPSSKHGGQKQQMKVDSAVSNRFELGSMGQKGLDYKGREFQGKDVLGCFFDSLCKYARYSRFVVKATLRHGDLLNTASMVCSLSFDRDQEYFATAGVCKRIKIFDCDAVLNDNVDIHYPVIEMPSRSKLSCVCWNSYIKSHIASSDYDGVVQLWDASTGQTLMRYEEHEKRVWSVDFSQTDPTKLASGSDDGFVKLWSINQEGSIGTIKTKANVCCVQYPPDSAHLITFGSADYKIYCYDLRNMKVPWCTLTNHSKAVSFVKFLDAVTLVSASTDNTLKLWDLSRASSTDGGNRACVLTYTGHTNEKNFVGLSVMDGYIACGSETNSVFAYHKSLPMPTASHKFGGTDPLSGQEIEDDTGQFVSSVCWRGKSQTLVAANSMGNIKVLEMV